MWVQHKTCGLGSEKTKVLRALTMRWCAGSDQSDALELATFGISNTALDKNPQTFLSSSLMAQVSQKMK